MTPKLEAHISNLWTIGTRGNTCCIVLLCVRICGDIRPQFGCPRAEDPASVVTGGDDGSNTRIAECEINTGIVKLGRLPSFVLCRGGGGGIRVTTRWLNVINFFESSAL